MKIQYVPMCIVASLLVAGCATTPKSIPLDAAPESTSPHGAAPPAARDTTNPTAMFNVMAGELALQRGQIDEALDHYFAAARASLDPGVIERAARIADYTLNGERGAELATLWIEHDPKNLEARLFYANALMRQGKTDAAVHELELIVLLVGGERQIYSRIASQLAREKDQDGALTVMDKLVQRHKDEPYARLALAQLATRLNRLPLALQHADDAIQLKPDWPDALVLRAHVLQMMNKTEDALKLYSDALNGTLAENFTLRMSYARLLLDLKQFPEAHEQYSRLARQQPDNGDVVYAAALLAMQTSHYDEAERLLLQLIGLRERTSESSYYLGQIAEKNKNPEQALKWYGQVGHGEFHVNARMRKAGIIAKQGKVDEALADLRSVKTSSPQELMQLFMMEGDIYLEAGKHKNAYDVYDRALKDMPDNSNLLYARALAAEKLDRIDIAEQDLRNILKAEPDNVQALNALGYTLADRTQRYHEALTLIQRALTLEPKDAAIIDSMGWVQFRLGNHSEAINYLKQALDISQDSEIAAHLGEVLWVAGKKNEAKAVFDQARKNTPDNKILQGVMRRLGL